MSTLNPLGRVVTDLGKPMKSHKLLTCTTNRTITTFNPCTLRKDYSIDELTNSIEEQNLDIICIQEHRFCHDEVIKYSQISSKYTLITSSAVKNESNASIGGVGIILNNSILECVTSVEKISPRILVISFSGNPASIIVICYSPHNTSPEEEVFEIYNDLSKLVDSIPAHNVLFVCGDFNAQLGKDDILYSFHENTNRNS